MKTLVILETPYSPKSFPDMDPGSCLKRNIQFAQMCMRDSLLRNEAPFMSHLLYTQENVLDDNNLYERMLGIDAGLDWGSCAESTIVYTNLGITSGMKYGIKSAETLGRPIYYRELNGWNYPG